VNDGAFEIAQRLHTRVRLPRHIPVGRVMPKAQILARFSGIFGDTLNYSKSFGLIAISTFDEIEPHSSSLAVISSLSSSEKLTPSPDCRRATSCRNLDPRHDLLSN